MDEFKYKMTKEMADFFLKNRDGNEKKKQKQEYLCEVVNSTFGIMGKCIEVIVG